MADFTQNGTDPKGQGIRHCTGAYFCGHLPKKTQNYKIHRPAVPKNRDVKRYTH